jgi:hypothetical protein
MNLQIPREAGMDNRRNANGIAERLAVQEKALSSLADSIRKYEVESAEEIHDLQSEFKALKMFLARTTPEFENSFRRSSEN